MRCPRCKTARALMVNTVPLDEADHTRMVRYRCRDPKCEIRFRIVEKLVRQSEYKPAPPK